MVCGKAESAHTGVKSHDAKRARLSLGKSVVLDVPNIPVRISGSR